MTASVFLRVAESRSLFSRAMRLSPLPLLLLSCTENDDTDGGTAALASGEAYVLQSSSLTSPLMEANHARARSLRLQLGALVHRKITEMTPAVIKLMQAVPERWRVMLAEALEQVQETLTEAYQQGRRQRKSTSAYGSSNGDVASSTQTLGPALWAIDGLQPFVAYRRLLSVALAAKCFSDNPLLPGEVFGGNVRNNFLSNVSKMKIFHAEAALSGLEQVRHSFPAVSWFGIIFVV